LRACKKKNFLGKQATWQMDERHPTPSDPLGNMRPSFPMQAFFIGWYGWRRLPQAPQNPSGSSVQKIEWVLGFGRA
jgi:hypothetical protein